MSWVEEYNEEDENLSDHQKMTRQWTKILSLNVLSSEP